MITSCTGRTVIVLRRAATGVAESMPTFACHFIAALIIYIYIIIYRPLCN